jgi:hypothetical protein
LRRRGGTRLLLIERELSGLKTCDPVVVISTEIMHCKAATVKRRKRGPRAAPSPGLAARGGHCKIWEEVAVKFGIAGWPLRTLSLDGIAEVIHTVPSSIIEIPKDLLNSVSTKKLFGILVTSKKSVSLAGTTDFTRLSDLSWGDYQNYLDIQFAFGRFFKCKIFRVFLQARTREQLELSVSRVIEYAQRFTDIEIVFETHGGYESTKDGFEFCINTCSLRTVIDFGNISDCALPEFILDSNLDRRIAYFHVRNLPGYCELETLGAVEARAMLAYPQHTFLWEPKAVNGRRAVKIFRDCCGVPIVGRGKSE